MMSSETSLTMVSSPSGLLTCFVRASALSTLSRRFCAWALGICFLIGAAASALSAPRPVLLVMGDSLSAGYGINPGKVWLPLLKKRLQSEGYEYAVVNASVSGETPEGGLNRLPRALDLHHPRIVILELGANDGLRGLPLADTGENLQKM